MSKKMTKGAVAVAAGVALLLGGAGTYAWWSVSESVDDQGQIEAGDLDLAVGSPAWELNGDTVAAAEVRIVPGDILVLSQPLTITAIGDSLHAQLSLDSSGLTGDEDLGDLLEVDFALAGTPEWLTAEGDTYTITSGTVDAQDVQAQVTVEFPETTEGRDGATGTVMLDDLVYSLTQLPTGQ